MSGPELVPLGVGDAFSARVDLDGSVIEPLAQGRPLRVG